MAWTIQQGLEERGYTVDIAEDGAEAEQKARLAPYRVILLDFLLRDDGVALLRRWRRGGLMTHVLVLTASAAVADTVTALDAGADGCLTRPFQWEELLARVRSLIRRRHEFKDPVLRISDLEIDTDARTVKRGGRPIRLTAREYALLQFLARHRGKAVARPTILEHLSGDAEAITSNVVDVYIRSLRNKIDLGFEPRLILTSRGEGYLLRGHEAPMSVP
jgi:DNA-binding response OmpR family regulator